MDLDFLLNTPRSRYAQSIDLSTNVGRASDEANTLRLNKAGLRSRIQALSATGKTNQAVAQLTGSSISTVKRWKHRLGIKDAERPGRPNVLSTNDKEHIELFMKDNWGASVRTMAASLANNHHPNESPRTISHMTIHNYLKTTPWGRTAYKGQIKPLLSNKNITDRMTFCNKVLSEGYCAGNGHALEMLDHVLFTDESVIQLTPAPNRQNTRIRTDNPDRRIIHVPKKSLSIMVAGGMLSSGLTTLHVVDHRSTVNGAYYRERIMPIYANALSLHPQTNLPFDQPQLITFQQDGAPAHTANPTMEMVNSTFANVWSKNVWPGNSPDLNPIEHLWDVLQQSVFVPPRPTNRQQLIERVTEKWGQIPISLLQSLVYSFPKRIEECVAKHGRSTSY